MTADTMTDQDWANVYGITVEELYVMPVEEPAPFVCPNGYNDAACDAFCGHHN